MHVKRIEILIPSLDVPRLLKEMKACQIKGYSVVRDISGKGRRGFNSGDEITGVFTTSMILLACNDSEAQRLQERIPPILDQIGGLMLIQDAIRLS